MDGCWKLVEWKESIRIDQAMEAFLFREYNVEEWRLHGE